LLHSELVLSPEIILALLRQLSLLLPPESALLVRQPVAVVAIVTPKAIVIVNLLLLGALTFPLLSLRIRLLLLNSLLFQRPPLIVIVALPVLVLPFI
jgi:hypothetical protein